MPIFQARNLMIASVLSLLTAAHCGGDTAKADATTASDISAADTTTDVAKDAVTTTDAPAAETAAETAGTCATTCLNPQGQEDLTLCPKPVTDYGCIKGCCVKKFKCKVNADCADKIGVEKGCPSADFTCGCDVENEQCAQSICTLDTDCAKGQVCNQGGCKAPLGDSGLTARLLRPVWITGPNLGIDPFVGLGAQVSDGKGNVKLDAVLDWNLAGSAAFKLDAGQLKATETAGKTTITASGKGIAASNPAQLWNLGALPAGKNLRVTAIDDFTWAALTGKVVVIGMADQATPAAAMTADLAEGQASFADVKFPADIHLLGKDHNPLSVLRYDAAGKPGELLLPATLRHFAELEYDGKGALVKDKSKVIHGDAVKGQVDYPGEGEAMLGMTSLAFGPQLLNFSIDAILGPNVKRPFDDKAPTFLNPEPGKPQQIPGGVTFALGQPVVTSFIVAGPPGPHIVWTLGGRLSMGELTAEMGKIFEAASGKNGLDIGQIVSVLLPYLSGFSSDVQWNVMLGDKLADPQVELAKVKPKFPLLLKSDVEIAPLPKVGKGWADLAFVIGGALLPIGEIVPLGLTAGSDSAGKEDPADGLIDSDPNTKGNQPIKLSVAPLHSALQVGVQNHVVITAAVVLAGGGKKEGGSLILGAPGPIAAKLQPGPFMDLPLDSTFDPATATLKLGAVAGAHAYRMTLTAAEGAQWQVVLPVAAAGKTVVLPDLTTFGNEFPVAKTKRAYVGALEFMQQMDFVQFVGPGGLSDIVRKVKRTAFSDATP